MSIKVMIIDAQPEFRALLMHHVSAHWPDARISDFDPEASGHLPDEFSGAGNDIVLLGDRQGDRDGIDTLRRFTRVPGFPPVIYFGADEAAARVDAERGGAAGYLPRERVRHSALIIMMSDELRARRKQSTTASLFVGDPRAGVHPLIRGYRLQRRLSESGHSSVYLAARDQSGELVVLKVLRHLPEYGESIGAFDRFLQEYELIADLNHPNVVRIFDLGVSDDHAHITMEYLSGGDLKRRMAKGLSPEEAVSCLHQMASALAEIHKVGILHRDLKPGNVMLRDDGTLALIDFGLAKHMRLKQEITGSGEVFGTPYYMSPEQGRGDEIDHRSDIYSLGVIFFEMLAGDKPYRGSSAMGIIFKHSEAPVPRLPPRVAEYQELVERLLAKKPEDRLQQADDVERWL